jgi:hypothetical protein
MIAVCEAPDDESATALSFSFEETKRILDKMVLRPGLTGRATFAN